MMNKQQSRDTESQPLHLELSPEESEPLLIQGYLRRQILFLGTQRRKGSTPSTSEAAKTGKPGLYQVELTFQPPANATPHEPSYELGSSSHGDSLLQMSVLLPDGTDHFEITIVRRSATSETADVGNIIYRCDVNEAGFLSIIRTTLRADNFQQAERDAWMNLAPLLSAWCFAHNIPLDVARIRVEEVATGTQQHVYLRMPYRRISANAFQIANLQITEHYHPLVYYREALSSVSPHYQFLCFYKAVELVRHLTSQGIQRKRKEGLQPRVVAERLEENDWTREHLTPVLLQKTAGRTFNDICDRDLRPIRNRIAHAFLDNTEPADQDAEALLEPSEIYEHLPLLQYIARRMIAAYFNISV